MFGFIFKTTNGRIKSKFYLFELLRKEVRSFKTRGGRNRSLAPVKRMEEQRSIFADQGCLSSLVFVLSSTTCHLDTHVEFNGGEGLLPPITATR